MSRDASASDIEEFMLSWNTSSIFCWQLYQVLFTNINFNFLRDTTCQWSEEEEQFFRDKEIQGMKKMVKQSRVVTNWKIVKVSFNVSIVQTLIATNDNSWNIISIGPAELRNIPEAHLLCWNLRNTSTESKHILDSGFARIESYSEPARLAQIDPFWWAQGRSEDRESSRKGLPEMITTFLEI